MSQHVVAAATKKSSNAFATRSPIVAAGVIVIYWKLPAESFGAWAAECTLTVLDLVELRVFTWLEVIDTLYHFVVRSILCALLFFAVVRSATRAGKWSVALGILRTILTPLLFPGRTDRH